MICADAGEAPMSACALRTDTAARETPATRSRRLKGEGRESSLPAGASVPVIISLPMDRVSVRFACSGVFWVGSDNPRGQVPYLVFSGLNAAAESRGRLNGGKQ